MTYYVFIENEKINGAGQCKVLNEGILNIEVEEEIYDTPVLSPIIEEVTEPAFIPLTIEVIIFSLIPPTGKILPDNVNSPVIAISLDISEQNNTLFVWTNSQ